MRTLFFVEPVVFRGDPLFLAPHVMGWGLPMLHAHREASADPWVLASSRALCDLATQHVSDLETCALPSWSLLAGLEYDRHRYAAALFDPAITRQACEGKGVLAPLFAALQPIRQSFAPELVIATAQNCVLCCPWCFQMPASSGLSRPLCHAFVASHDFRWTLVAISTTRPFSWVPSVSSKCRSMSAGSAPSRPSGGA